jgi:hypothetical protein
LQTFQRTKRSEGIAISNDAFGERRSDVPERYDLFNTGGVEIDRSGWFGCLPFPFVALGFTKPRLPRGIGRPDLGFQRGARFGIGRISAVKRANRPPGCTENKDD